MIIYLHLYVPQSNGVAQEVALLCMECLLIILLPVLIRMAAAAICSIPGISSWPSGFKHWPRQPLAGQFGFMLYSTAAKVYLIICIYLKQNSTKQSCMLVNFVMAELQGFHTLTSSFESLNSESLTVTLKNK